MSHHAHLLVDIRKNSRATRDAQPFDHLTKAELWERLQAAESALTQATQAAQRAATTAHGYAQGATGEQRRQFIAVRDAAYKARDAAVQRKAVAP